MKYLTILSVLALVACNNQNTSWDRKPLKQPTKCSAAVEQTSKIPLDNTQKNKALVFKSHLKKGLYLVIMQFEVSNEVGYTVGIGRQLLLNGKNVIPAVMDNVMPEEHHKVIQVESIVNVNMESDLELYATAVSYSTIPGDFITIEQCYGYMQIQKLEQ